MRVRWLINRNCLILMMKGGRDDFNPFSNVDPDIFFDKMDIFNWGNDLAKAKLEDRNEEEDSFSVTNSQGLWCGCAVYVSMQFRIMDNVYIWLHVVHSPLLWIINSGLGSQMPGLNSGPGFYWLWNFRQVNLIFWA